MLERYIQLAWRSVRIRVHPELAVLLKPFHHLESPPQTPELKIEIHLAGEDREDATAFYPTKDGATYTLPRSHGVYSGNRMTAHFQHPDKLSPYELGRPLHALLALWHTHVGTPLIHAGAVNIQGRGFLLGGRSGSGKSTAALSCLQDGFVSDDMTALRGLEGHGLYATSFVAGPPHLATREKTLRYLPKVQPTLNIDALVFPSRTGPTQRISASQALLGLAPSSVLVGQLTGGQGALDQLAALVRQVPSFRLAWQPDMAAALRELP